MDGLVHTTVDTMEMHETADATIWMEKQVAGGTQWVRQLLWRQRDRWCFEPIPYIKMADGGKVFNASYR